MTEQVPGQMELPLGFQFEEHPQEQLVDRLRRELAEVQQANALKYQEFRKAGGQFDPVSIVMLRLAMLLDMLLPEEARLQYDINFEQQMARLLDDGQSQVRRAKLTQPMTPPPGAGVPGSGLFVPGR